ncbi:hypothetical protein MBLNU459_g1419t1 [Dothideomycetes sp. NU459]
MEESENCHCKDAMFENLVVIGRMNERIQLLRAEVERRGMRWADAEVEERTMTDANGEGVNGVGGSSSSSGGGGGGGVEMFVGGSAQRQAPRAPSGTLTDEELRARLLERLGDDDEAGEDDGVHL